MGHMRRSVLVRPDFSGFEINMAISVAIKRLKDKDQNHLITQKILMRTKVISKDATAQEIADQI